MAATFELERISSSSGEQGQVAFHSSPTADEWSDLEQGIRASLQEGVLSWRFDLCNLRFCDSHGLGMWLRMNSLIRDASGQASFVIREPSRILELFRLTKLDQVVDVEIHPGPGGKASAPG